MQRAKKIVFVAHCIMNVNSKVIGLANYSGVLTKLVEQFIKKDYGIVQLPCPELQYMGLKRWSMTKEQYNFLGYRNFCRQLAEDNVKQMLMYQEEGYELCGLFGIDGSPSCGVKHSCAGFNGGCFESYETFTEIQTNEQGVFIEELVKLINLHNININFYSINEANPDITEI